jgi:hypothetical protein
MVHMTPHPGDVDVALADLNGIYRCSWLHVRYENAAYRAGRLPVSINRFGLELRRRGLFRTILKGRPHWLLKADMGVTPCYPPGSSDASF